jgi:DNA recombination protein RmuC
MEGVFVALGFIVGGVLGWGIVWVSGWSAREADRARALAQEARIADREARLSELRGELEGCRGRESGLRSDLAALGAKHAGVTESLRVEQRAAEEKLRLVEETKEKAAISFQALSAEALRVNREDFLQLARTSLEKFQEGAQGDLTQRQKAIEELVKPVHESLHKFDGRVADIENTRMRSYGALTQMLESLQTETARLGNALRAPAHRGRWAEMHLRRTVELAGLTDQCDFYEQETVSGDEETVRPDMVIRLPAGRTVLVDAKAPLEAYLEAAQATDEAQREARLRDHAAQVRQHVQKLSRKTYWARFSESAELVILYLPSDALFAAALDHDRELLDAALSQRIVLATPSTLSALLLTVAHGWKQERLADNAREIAGLGRELHKRLSDSAKHLDKLGRSLGGAVRAYNETVGSLESRVLPTARRFRDLSAAHIDVEIAPLTPIEAAARPLTAAELTAPALPEDAN